MYENNQEDTLDTLEKSASAAHKIQSGLKTGKSISAGAKGAASPYAAAASMIWEHRETVRKGICAAVVFFLLPVVFVVMLPTVVFDDVTTEREIPLLNDNAKLTQNIKDGELAVWGILKESHDNIISQIDAEIADLGENETSIVTDEYATGNPIVRPDRVLCKVI